MQIDPFSNNVERLRASDQELSLAHSLTDLEFTKIDGQLTAQRRFGTKVPGWGRLWSWIINKACDHSQLILNLNAFSLGQKTSFEAKTEDFMLLPSTELVERLATHEQIFKRFQETIQHKKESLSVSPVALSPLSDRLIRTMSEIDQSLLRLKETASTRANIPIDEETYRKLSHLKHVVDVVNGSDADRHLRNTRRSFDDRYTSLWIQMSQLKRVFEMTESSNPIAGIIERNGTLLKDIQQIQDPSYVWDNHADTDKLNTTLALLRKLKYVTPLGQNEAILEKLEEWLWLQQLLRDLPEFRDEANPLARLSAEIQSPRLAPEIIIKAVHLVLETPAFNTHWPDLAHRYKEYQTAQPSKMFYARDARGNPIACGDIISYLSSFLSINDRISLALTAKIFARHVHKSLAGDYYSAFMKLSVYQKLLIAEQLSKPSEATFTTFDKSIKNAVFEWYIGYCISHKLLNQVSKLIASGQVEDLRFDFKAHNYQDLITLIDNIADFEQIQDLQSLDIIFDSPETVANVQDSIDRLLAKTSKLKQLTFKMDTEAPIEVDVNSLPYTRIQELGELKELSLDNVKLSSGVLKVLPPSVSKLYMIKVSLSDSETIETLGQLNGLGELTLISCNCEGVLKLPPNLTSLCVIRKPLRFEGINEHLKLKNVAFLIFPVHSEDALISFLPPHLETLKFMSYEDMIPFTDQLFAKLGRFPLQKLAIKCTTQITGVGLTHLPKTVRSVELNTDLLSAEGLKNYYTLNRQRQDGNFTHDLGNKIEFLNGLPNRFVTLVPWGIQDRHIQYLATQNTLNALEIPDTIGYFTGETNVSDVPLPTSLRKLKINNSVNWQRLLANLNRLEDLEITPPMGSLDNQLEYLPLSIRHLKLLCDRKGTLFDFTDRVISHLERLVNLETLSIASNKLTGSTLHHLPPQLKSLTVVGADFRFENIELLRNKHLHQLSLYIPGKTTADHLSSHLNAQTLPSTLRELSLQIQDANSFSFKRLEGHQQLRTLKLNINSNINNPQFIKKLPKQIEKLEIRNEPMTNECLACLSEFTNLKELSLSTKNGKDQEQEYFHLPKSLVSLTFDLSKEKMFESFTRAVCKLQLPNLRRLKIIGKRLKENEKAMIAEKFPFALMS